MWNKDRANLLAILDAIEKIQDYLHDIHSAEEYHQSSMVFDATLMNFVVIGEMVDRLSPDVKTRSPSLDWQQIKDFRNLIAHDYLGIDAEEVWQIIHDHLPPLRMELERILKNFPSA